MRGDGGVDIEREGQGGAPVFAGNAWRRAGAYAVEERLDFETQRFARPDLGLLDVEPGKSRNSCAEATAAADRGGIGSRRARDVDDEQILACVVDRDILMGLEEAQLADLLRADAAGGEVGDAARLELDADVRDIDLAARGSAGRRRAASEPATARGSARCRGRAPSGRGPRPRRVSAG